MNEIPVYFFTGFMDSGKTTLIQETLFENSFADDKGKLLIISCEDGDEPYDVERLATIHASLEMIEEEEDFTTANLVELDQKHLPNAVFIEYNGTWETGKFYEMELPQGWTIVQSLATVDATTFELYLSNMRSMMMEQVFRAEVVIFNRCTDETPKVKFRGQVKAINRPAQIVYERADGTIDESEDELPFDITADIIEISDADYAIWFMDCMENPKKYNGKKVHFLGLVYNPAGNNKLRRGTIVPGRFAMTCCVEDIQFLGMMCKTNMENPPAHRSWIDLTATVKLEFTKEYKGKGPILYPISITEATKPEDELVYFS